MGKDKITDCISDLKELIDDWAKIETREMEEQAELLIITKAVQLTKLAEPQNSKTSCDCEEDDFDDDDDGIAYACIRTAQIKTIDFSEDGVSTINMRHGEPIIFKDISEVMFIS